MEGTGVWRRWQGSASAGLRRWPVRAVLVVVGWVVACGVGVLLWRGALRSMQDELRLKCENRREVLKSEVENHLNASFVIVGLVASVPQLDEAMWVEFSQRTLFLRPNVKRLVYVERVLASERAEFERRWNSSILYFTPDNKFVRREANDTEYSPIVYETDDEYYRFVDSGAYPLYRSTINTARDTGRFTLSPITLRRQTSTWQMGAYIAYYGPGRDYTSFATVDARRNACLGYVGSVFNATDVFYRVLSRFTDDVDVDVVAVFIVDPTSGLQSYYNCSETAAHCVIPLFDPGHRASDVSRVAVSWVYGTQQFELRCLPKNNLTLLALRSVVAWPLLMSLVVIFFSVIVYLVLKRMQSIEKDVAVMERMNEDLKVAKLAAEAADKAKSNFLATVSHEIRTPMNGVIGMTNLLMGTELTAQQLEYVKVAQASGNSLIALINDVLDLSKIEAGRMELESVAFNIRREVDSVFQLFDERVQHKKIDMSMLVHDTVPTCILGDPGRFRQILGNLIANALKFTKEGSILVCVRVMDHNQEDSADFTAIDVDQKTATPGDVQLSQVLPNETLAQVGDEKLIVGRRNTPPRLSIQPGSETNCSDAVESWRNWKLTTTAGESSRPKHFTIFTSVEDTGIGIPDHLEHHLFQPFSQANSSTSREHGGTGIGLSICQKLVRLMNGDITVKSKVGGGSVFEFTLPVRISEGSKPCCSVFPLEEKRLNGIHVTLVDSNLVRQEVSASYLRCLGINVELAEDVESALEILKTGGTTMQAILVDLDGFPSASVTPLACSIRSSSTLKALPVLALSLGLPPAVERELKDSGVSDIVPKPLRYSTLICVLLEAIGIVPKPSAKKVNKVNDNAKLLSGKRLLVVDDNMVNRRVATSMLKKYGAIVSSVNGGGEAVSAIKNQKEDEKLDLVLMDIQMPEMDGWEATRRIRSWEAENCDICRLRNLVRCDHRRLPIVAVTADALKGTHTECINAGMDDYLTKPLDQKHLHSLLERFIRNEMHDDSPKDEQPTHRMNPLY